MNVPAGIRLSVMPIVLVMDLTACSVGCSVEVESSHPTAINNINNSSPSFVFIAGVPWWRGSRLAIRQHVFV